MRFDYNQQSSLEDQLKYAHKIVASPDMTCSGIPCSQCPLRTPFHIEGVCLKITQVSHKTTPSPSLISYMQAFIAFHEGV